MGLPQGRDVVAVCLALASPEVSPSCATLLDQEAQRRFVNDWAVGLDYPVAEVGPQSVGRRQMAPETSADGDGDSAGAVPPDLGALYLAHRDAMYGMAYSLLRGDHHRAEDMVQQVMLSLMPTLPRGVRNWEAFLVKAVKNKVYDLWKSAASKHEQLVLEGARPAEDQRHAPDDLDVDPALVVEEAEQQDATVAQVRAVMSELERRAPRAAYVLKQVKQMERTSRDVAHELGVSDSRVRQHVIDARSELRLILDAQGGEP